MNLTINYLGAYYSFGEVWKTYPHGGLEGDYLRMNDVIYVWDKFIGNWVVFNGPDTVNDNQGLMGCEDVSDENNTSGYNSVSLVSIENKIPKYFLKGKESEQLNVTINNYVDGASLEFPEQLHKVELNIPVNNPPLSCTLSEGEYPISHYVLIDDKKVDTEFMYSGNEVLLNWNRESLNISVEHPMRVIIFIKNK